MKTITITLDQTLADLEKQEGLDFGYNCANPDKWFVVDWHRTWDGDAIYATCNTGENNDLVVFYADN